jgi:hypothetical protein
MSPEEAKRLLDRLNTIEDGVPSWSPPADEAMPMHGNSSDACVNPPSEQATHAIISSRLRSK